MRTCTALVLLAVVALLGAASAARAQSCPYDVVSGVAAQPFGAVLIDCGPTPVATCGGCASAWSAVFAESCWSLACAWSLSFGSTASQSQCQDVVNQVLAEHQCPGMSAPPVPAVLQQCSVFGVMANFSGLFDAFSCFQQGECAPSCQAQVDAIVASPCWPILCAPGTACASAISSQASPCLVQPALGGLPATSCAATNSATLGASGGAIQTPVSSSVSGGATGSIVLSVPSNAVDAVYGTLPVAVSELTSAAAAALSLDPAMHGTVISPIVALTPHGVLFDAPVTVTIPYFPSAAPVAAGKRRCAVRNPATAGAMQAIADCGGLTYDASAHTATFTTTTFSTYAVADVDAGVVPSPSPSPGPGPLPYNEVVFIAEIAGGVGGGSLLVITIILGCALYKRNRQLAEMRRMNGPNIQSALLGAGRM